MNEVKSMIPLPIYNYRIYIIFTDDLIGSAEKLVKQGRLAKDHGVDGNTDGFHVRFKDKSASFLVIKFTASMNHITHEAYHAVSTLFRWISAQHEEELFAYHLGYVAGLIVQDMRAANKKLEKILEKGVDKSKKR